MGSAFRPISATRRLSSTCFLNMPGLLKLTGTSSEMLELLSVRTGERHCHDLEGSSRQELREPRISLRMLHGTSQDRMRTNNLPRDIVARPVCLPEIKSSCSDDAIHLKLADRECGPPPGQHAGSAHLCSVTNVSGLRCGISCTTAAGDEGAVPQAPRRGQRIPFGSSRSDVPHIHFATVTAATLVDLGCPSRGHAG